MTNKFRIFDKKNNCYLEEPDYRWLLSRNGKLYNTENDEWHVIGERYVVEFLTGLFCRFDKTKEYYEGDLFKYNGVIYKIVYGEKTAAFHCESLSPNVRTPFFYLHNHWEHIYLPEIIGNINENPELMK